MFAINRVKATKQQLSDWDDTRAALMHFAPAFTHLFYTLMNKDDDYVAVFTDSPFVPTAATDGSSVIINVNTYFKHSLMERVFILGHEILHNILNHILLLHHLSRTGRVVLADGKTLPYHPVAIQYALDYVVNAILINAKLGKPPVDLVFDLSVATHMDSVLDVYAKLVKAGGGGRGKKPGDQPSGRGGKPGGGGKDGEEGDEQGENREKTGRKQGENPDQAPGGFDTHLPPGTVEGKDPTVAEAEHNQAEWDVNIKAAMELAKGQGKLPAVFEYLFGEIIADKTDWTDIVQSWFARRIGSGGADYRHPDRKLIVRDIWAPGRAGFGCDLIVIGCDTSGSIWAQPKAMDRWFGVLANILEQLRPKQIVVVWCDAGIGRVDDVEDAIDLAEIHRKHVPGGGGTDFRPVFDYVWDQRLEPDGLVYLTDGYGTFPQRAPGYPVFWGSIALGPQGYPFGEVVMVPTD